MFKTRRKRQQQKLAAAAAAAATQGDIEKLNGSQYLLDDIQVAHDFRSSVILPQLNKDLDPMKMTRQQEHLQQLREIPESPPLSPPPHHQLRLSDGTRQYQDLAAWRHLRSQNRYSNGLFGGKQRGRPKPKQIKKIIKNENGELEEILVQEELTAETSVIDMLQQQNMDFSDDDEEDMLNSSAVAADSLPEESYEPDSEEENYFFQDFSADTKKKPAKKSTTRKRQAPTKKFDLSSFARDLHEHRLSVVQRESRIIMTEEDELELEKLLERQRERMSMMLPNESVESVHPPPMPSLDALKSHQLPALAEDHSSTTSIQKDELVDEVSQTPVEPVYTPHVYAPPVHTTVVKPSPIQIPVDNDPPVLSTPVYTLPVKMPPVPTAQTTTSTAPIRTPSTRSTLTPTRSLSTQVRSLASVSASRSNAPPKIEVIKRSISTTSIRSSTSTSTTCTRTRLAPIRDDETRPSARKSISMDFMKLDENEPSVTSAALDWISEDNSQDPTSFLYRKAIPTPPQQPITAPKASRSLFGSLRQVSRSKTHHAGHGGGGVNSIKGLVRNFSSSHKPERDSGMSRAAMAVIQHDVTKKKEKPVARTKSDVNIIANLIARASSGKTKEVNMEDSKKKRAQVVRRTIIYVQPDSLHDMLKNNLPPLPSLPTTTTTTTRHTMMSDQSLSPDDETVRSKEYVTATKIVRQTSVRKRVVDANQPALARQASGKRYQLKSVDEHDLFKQDKKRVSSSSSENSDCIEGVELREMSDGTVVWGLVKKQEPTSSEEEKQQGSPPPIPKRSPRRQETDVYYSDQVTLPHLLKMMQGQHPGDAYELDQRAMTSVDDQLDEMMRILTSAQKQQQA